MTNPRKCVILVVDWSWEPKTSKALDALMALPESPRTLQLVRASSLLEKVPSKKDHRKRTTEKGLPKMKEDAILGFSKIKPQKIHLLIERKGEWFLRCSPSIPAHQLHHQPNAKLTCGSCKRIERARIYDVITSER